MNWIAFNDAHDVVLPGSKGKPLPFLMYPQAEVAGTRRRQPRSRALQVHDHRARSVIAGINYPWTVFDGRANYGCDFGRNKWDSHAGVTAHADDVRADFAAMAAAGHRGHALVRVHRRPRRHSLDAVTARLPASMPSSSTTWMPRSRSPSSSGVRLCLVLVDYPWFDDPQRRLALLDRDGASAFLDRVLDPFLDRYGKATAIHSFDVINEPDWVTQELATNPEARGVAARSPADVRRADVGAHPRTVRPRLITLGGGRVAPAREWDHPAYGLDFVQVHSYPDVRYPDRDDSVFGRTAASFGLSKPLLIGECPSHPRLHPAGHLSPAYSLEDYLTLAREGGYLGAWPWSFKGVDAFGAADLMSVRRAGLYVLARLYAEAGQAPHQSEHDPGETEIHHVGVHRIDQRAQQRRRGRRGHPGSGDRRGGTLESLRQPVGGSHWRTSRAITIQNMISVTPPMSPASARRPINVECGSMSAIRAR